jgi:RimJ/RimL family protein N-acetyltransferase
MAAQEAALIATWHYNAEWSVYDLGSPQPLLDGLVNYHSVFAGERLIGFCCTGIAARIPGMTAEPGTLDVGMGMDPTHVGRGYGAVFGEAVLGYLVMRYPGRILRAVVQEWNQRSLRLTRRLGFVDTGEVTVLQRGEPVTYRVVIKGANSDTS